MKRIEESRCAGLAWIVALMALMAAWPGVGLAQNTEAEYLQKFAQAFAGQMGDANSTPTLDQYATAAHFDQLFMGDIDAQVNLINEKQNRRSEMAWGTAYLTHALNDMYIATGDSKYLRANLKLVRASLANTDKKKGFKTFFGEADPGWGTDEYAGRWVVHPVHTGMIGFGIAEFLRLAPKDEALMKELGPEYKQMVAEITETVDWHNRQWGRWPRRRRRPLHLQG